MDERNQEYPQQNNPELTDSELDLDAIMKEFSPEEETPAEETPVEIGHPLRYNTKASRFVEPGRLLIYEKGAPIGAPLGSFSSSRSYCRSRSYCCSDCTYRPGCRSRRTGSAG